MLWRAEETDSVEEMMERMSLLKVGRRDSVASHHLRQGTVYWWECENSHPCGPPPRPGLFARDLYQQAEEMLQTEGYDMTEAEGLLERAIDIYARMSLTIGAIELSMKLAMLVHSRAKLPEEDEYVRNLLSFAIEEIGKPGYEDSKQETLVALGILEGYILTDKSAQKNDSKGVERGIGEIEIGYKMALENEYQGSIDAAENYLPMAQNFRL